MSLVNKLYHVSGDTKIGWFCAGLAHLIWAVQKLCGKKGLASIDYQLTEAKDCFKFIWSAPWFQQDDDEV